MPMRLLHWQLHQKLNNFTPLNRTIDVDRRMASFPKRSHHSNSDMLIMLTSHNCCIPYVWGGNVLGHPVIPYGSAGSPDGLRPQHFKDLTEARGGREVLQALTFLINLVLEGKIPHSVRSFFLGGHSDRVTKEGWRHQASTVGNALRQLLSKCAGSHVVKVMGDHLALQQLGFCTPLGCEAAAHVPCSYLHNMAPDHLILIAAWGWIGCLKLWEIAY